MSLLKPREVYKPFEKSNRCKPLDIISLPKFERLTVIEDLGVRNKNRYLKCECDCGTVKEIAMGSVFSGNTKSCGCLAQELRRKRCLENPISRSKKGRGVSTFNRIYNQYKRIASKRGHDFDLSKEFFKEVTKRNCFYCKDPPSNVGISNYDNGDYIYNGLDRIDNEKGYCENNVVSCCKSCNVAKNNMSKDEFFSKIEKIYLNHIQEDS